MIKLLGVFFLVLLIELPLILVDLFVKNGFIQFFVHQQSLEIMGTLLGLNIASSIFLIGHLIDIEAKLDKDIFDATKKEMKQNIIAMFVMFIIELIIQIAMPIILPNSPQIIKDISMWLSYVGLYVFLLYLFALFEMTQAIFIVGVQLRKALKK